MTCNPNSGSWPVNSDFPNLFPLDHSKTVGVRKASPSAGFDSIIGHNYNLPHRR